MRALSAPLVTLALAGAALAAVSFSGGAPQGGGPVQFKLEHAGGSVHMLTGQGGNIGLSVGPDGVLMIDDQFAPLAQGIREQIDALAKTAGLPDGPTPLRWVLNTHHHGDHTGGNAIFAQLAPIVAHENVRARLMKPGRDGKTPDAAGLPVLTYRQGIQIHFNGEEIELEHLPAGHTDGDSVVWFKGSNVVHMGDTFFAGRFPFVDLDSGGSAVQLERNIAKVLERVDAKTRILPGHGPLATKADLERYHAMLKDSLERVRAGLAEGRSVDELEQRGILKDYEAWSWSFITTRKYLENLARELKP